MSDLPKDCLEETSSFTYIWIDLFKPFYIHDGKKTRKYKKKTNGIQWIKNPPHSSHQGGILERKIESVRRILDSSHK